jgi:outer membrane protein
MAICLLAGEAALAADIDVATETISLEQSVIGLGVAGVPDYEGSDDYEAVPFLQLRFNLTNDMYFSFLGNTARLNIIPSRTWHFGPFARYRMERKDVDNERVDALEDIDAAVEVGAFLMYNLPNWVFSLSAAQDVADAHDGYVVDLAIGFRHQIQKQTLMTIFAKTTYASDDYMDTYFCIDAADSQRSGLTVYEAEDAELQDVGVGVAVQHYFNRNWGVLGVAKYTKLLGDASDSPIVDDEGDDNQWLGGVLVNYRF